MMSGKSFKNKIEPSTLPCGTPEVTDNQPDIESPRMTRSRLLDRKDLIQLRTWPLIPYLDILRRRRLCGTIMSTESFSE